MERTIDVNTMSTLDIAYTIKQEGFTFTDKFSQLISWKSPTVLGLDWPVDEDWNHRSRFCLKASSNTAKTEFI